MFRRSLWFSVAWCYLATCATPAWGSLILSPARHAPSASTHSTCRCNHQTVIRCCCKNSGGLTSSRAHSMCPITQSRKRPDRLPILTFATCTDSFPSPYGTITSFRLDPHLPLTVSAVAKTPIAQLTPVTTNLLCCRVSGDPADKVPI